MPIQWQPWNAEAFARARAERKPVLLSLSATWCACCREMDRTSYADPRVIAMVRDGFVPIRVDADRRPDIAERYSLGGLPTTAFLTGDGALAGGGTFVPADRLPDVLHQVSEAFDSRAGQIAGSAAVWGSRDARNRAEILPEPDDLVAQVMASFDRERGGFGREPKFPLTAPLELALQLYRDAPDDAIRSVLEVTLDAMGWGGLYDEVDGGFFRFAAARDWQSPHVEKLLDVNAALLGLYAAASVVLQIARYAERAQDVLRYLQTWLADPVEGGWSGSQEARAAYYGARTAEARRVLSPPAVDGVLYATANAAMTSSALRAAPVLGDPALAEFALRSLERVVLATYVPGAGVAHSFDGQPGVRGLLDDQISMATAHLDAHDATGNIVYEMMAEELAHYALRTMWDDEAGGFFDRAAAADDEAIGLMRQRLKPFVGNCEAARLLARLAAASGESDFAARADAALASVAPQAGRQGPLAAHYLLALREARIR
jgi:uncharacterized protein YyaL (SSP411 family)